MNDHFFHSLDTWVMNDYARHLDVVFNQMTTTVFFKPFSVPFSILRLHSMYSFKSFFSRTWKWAFLQNWIWNGKIIVLSCWRNVPQKMLMFKCNNRSTINNVFLSPSFPLYIICFESSFSSCKTSDSFEGSFWVEVLNSTFNSGNKIQL